MSSFVLAPVIAVSVLPVCRRSCGFRSSSTPTAFFARCQARYQTRPAERLTLRAAEQQPLLARARERRQAVLQLGLQQRWDRDRPQPGPRLGRTERPLAAL